MSPRTHYFRRSIPNKPAVRDLHHRPTRQILGNHTTAAEELDNPSADHDISVGHLSVDNPSVDDPSVDDPSVDDPSVDNLYVDDISVDDLPVDHPSVDHLSIHL